MLPPVRFGQLYVDEPSIRQYHLDRYDPEQIIDQINHGRLYQYNGLEQLDRMGMDVYVKSEPEYVPPERMTEDYAAEHPEGTFSPMFSVRLVDREKKTDLHEYQFYPGHGATGFSLVASILISAYDYFVVGDNGKVTLRPEQDDAVFPSEPESRP